MISWLNRIKSENTTNLSLVAINLFPQIKYTDEQVYITDKQINRQTIIIYR